MRDLDARLVRDALRRSLRRVLVTTRRGFPGFPEAKGDARGKHLYPGQTETDAERAHL